MNVKEKGMQKKMFLVIAALAAVAIAALVLILALGRKEETYRSIKIIELEGGVTIEREGVGILEASSNMNLISGDAVKTEQDAYAVLQLDSDKYVMLAEAGSMTVVAEGDEANGRTAIRLDSGSVLSEIQNPLSNGSSYDIVTPNATMSVRGTVFEVRRSGDDSAGEIEVLVYDGKVAVGLDGMESALYEAGEYAKFTVGQDPQFVIERTEITEEYLNPQFMERLEQINSQSRELNLGTAQLASAQPAADAEPQQTPAETPTQTEAPVQTATPKPEATPTATPKPAATPKPQASTTPAVTTAVPATEPPVESQEPDDDDDWNEADNSGSTQPDANTGNTGNGGSTGDSGNTGSGENTGNTGNSGNTGDGGNNQGSEDADQKQNFWQKYTWEEYSQAAANATSGATCTVYYYEPVIVEAQTTDGGSRSTVLVNTPPSCVSVQTTVGSKLTEPADYPKGREGLTFAGWCLEDGTIWDFENNVVEADMCLYPLWSEGTAIRYYPVICRSAENGTYYCNSVEEGSLLVETACTDPACEGWKRAVKRDNEKDEWDFEVDTVDSVKSLKASWSTNQ